MKSSTSAHSSSAAKTAVSPDSKIWLGWLMAITAIMAYSMNAPLGRGAILLGVNPTLLLIIRFGLSTAVAGGSLLLTDPKKFKIGRKGILTCIAIGGLIACAVLSFYWAIARMNVSIAAVIVSVYPLVVLMGLAFWGEKLTKRKGIRLSLGLGGVYLLLGPSGTADLIGVVLLIGTVISYALYLMFIQWYMGDYPVRAVAFYTDATMCVAMLIFGLAQGIKFEAPPVKAFEYIIVMAVIGTFLSRNLLFNAVRRIGSGQMSLLAPLDTMLTITWSLLFLNETLAPIQWVGSLLIVVSAFLAIEKLPERIRFRWGRAVR